MNNTFINLIRSALLLFTVILAACNTVRVGNTTSGAIYTFIESDSLSTTRMDHTATLLPNGKVLVCGGVTTYKEREEHFVHDKLLASAEVYDPVTRIWSATGSLGTARTGHTATLLANGKVLVTGGYTGKYENGKGLKGSELVSAEIYDSNTGIWTATGSLTTARMHHTATLLPSGKVMVAGGVNQRNVLATAELYDPTTGIWSETGSLGAAREEHTATLLTNGKVLVAGGYIGRYEYGKDTALAGAELYDPSTGIWTATGSLTMARMRHTATLLLDGKVLISGGSHNKNIGAIEKFVLGDMEYPVPLANSELYDSNTGTWVVTGSLASARRNHTATLLSNGGVLVAGGSETDFRSSVRNVIIHCDLCADSPVFTSAELYDPATGTWNVTDSLGTARRNHTATPLKNGNVLVSGGINEVGITASTEVYELRP